MITVPLLEAARYENACIDTVSRRIKTGKYRKLWSGRWLDKRHKEYCVPLEDLSPEAQERYWRERKANDETETQTALARDARARDKILIRAGAGDRGLRAGERENGETRLGQPAVAQVMTQVPEHIPVTPDGVPDVGALRAMGREAQAEEWDKRMRACARLDVELKRVEFGAIQAAWRRVAAEFGVSERTLRRWRADLEAAGPAGLVSGHGSHRGQTRVIPPALGKQMRETWLQDSQWSAEQLYRWIVIPYYQDLGLAYLPHITTIRRFIEREVLPLEATYFRGGKKDYRAHAEPRVTRELPPPNTIWVADHRIFDVMVLDGDRVVRPWLTAIIDVGSARWVGRRICRQPSAQTVCHALRQAILTCGVPEAFVRDMGREFSANRLGGRPQRLLRPGKQELDGASRWPAAMPAYVEQSSIWQALEVQLITCQAYSPWSKPIESLFGAWSRLWENVLPAWTGRDAKQKPEKLKGEIERGHLLTWDEFEFLANGLLDCWDANHICGERDRPPLEYYEDLSLQIPDPQTVGFLLQDRRSYKVGTRGVVIKGHSYMSEDLALYVGATLEVASDPAVPEWITVYTPDGRVLAVEESQKAKWLEFGEPNKIAKRAGRAQRRHLQGVKRELQGATPLARLDPTGAYQIVAERLQIDAETRRMGETARLALPEADAAALEQQEALQDAQDAQDNKPRRQSPYREIDEEFDALLKGLKTA